MSDCRGRVSVWINKVPLSTIPKTYFEEDYESDDGPLSEWSGSFGFDYYDHDFMDVASTKRGPKPIRKLVKGCSYIESFLEELEEAADKAGISEASHAVFLYDFDYARKRKKVKEDKYMRFLGTFDYDDSSELKGTR